MVKNIDNIDELIFRIKEEMKKGKKLKNMDGIISKYKGSDYKKYVNFSDSSYKRNMVYKDKKFEIYVICWNNNQQSSVHDHPENGCLLKILEGSLIEKVYKKKDEELVKIYTQYLEKNSISYMEGSNGLHSIKSRDNQTISIHIYSPPNYVQKYYKKN